MQTFGRGTFFSSIGRRSENGIAMKATKAAEAEPPETSGRGKTPSDLSRYASRPISVDFVGRRCAVSDSGMASVVLLFALPICFCVRASLDRSRCSGGS
ncbi:hypothetical protein NL676_026919 [Syzygium grande]|nr:hypothetical protein NL676_026919 [Syzygium grande]